MHLCVVQAIHKKMSQIIGVITKVTVLLTKTTWNFSRIATNLLSKCSGEGSLANLVGNVYARPSDPFRVDVLHALSISKKFI